METPRSAISRASKRRCLRREETGVCTPQNDTSPTSFFPGAFPSPAARSTAIHRTPSIARESLSNAECARIADRNEATPKTATPPDKGTFPPAPRHATEDADMAKQQYAVIQSFRDTNQGPHALVNALQEATDLALQTGGRQAELVALAQSALKVMRTGNPERNETATAVGTQFPSFPPSSSVLQHDTVLELLRQQRSESESHQALSMHLENEGETPQQTSIRKGQIIEGIDLLRLREETSQGNWAPTIEGVTHYDNTPKARYLEGLKHSAQLREAHAQLPTNPRDVQLFRAAVQNANSCRAPSPEQTSLRVLGTPEGNGNSATPASLQSSPGGTPHRRAEPSLAASAPLLCSPPGVIPAGFRGEASRPVPLASSSEVILQTLRALMSFTTPAITPAVPCTFSAPPPHSEKDLSISSVENLSALLCTHNAPAIIPTSSATGAGTIPRSESISEFPKAELSSHAFGRAMQPAAQNLLYSLLMSCGAGHQRQISAEREGICTGPSSARTPGRDIRQYSALPDTQDSCTSQPRIRPIAQSSTSTPSRILSPPSGRGLGNYETLSSPAENRHGSCTPAQSFGQSQPGEHLKDMQSAGRSGSTCNVSGLLAKKSHSVEPCHSCSEDTAQMTPTHSSYSSLRRRGSRLTADKDASPAGLRGATGEITGVSRGRSRTESLTRGDSMNRTDSLARAESTGKTGGAGRARGRYAAVAADAALAASSLGRGLDSTAGEGVAGCNQENEAGKPDVTLGGNRPHYHVAKQEWRVRYYLNGKRKMRTYSAKFYGYEAAHSMATDFAQYVDKNEALPHPVCKPVGLGGGRGAAYSSLMAARALSAAAVAKEREEHPDVSVGARYTPARHQQLMEKQPPPLHPQECSAAATAAKGLEALRLACVVAGNAAGFPLQQTHGAASATDAAAAARPTAGGVDAFSLDGESSPAVTRISGLSRSSTRVLQTSATPSEEENSSYYEQSQSGKVEADRESSSSGSHSHELHEESSLQLEYSCVAEQQTPAPSSLSAVDFSSDTTPATYLRSRKRSSSAMCYVGGRPPAPASLPGIAVPGNGVAAVAEKDGGNEDVVLDPMRLYMVSCTPPAGNAMIQTITEGSEGKVAATREGTTDKEGAEALFEGMQEREKLYLSKLFSSVWLPPASSQRSLDVAAARDGHDNSSRYTKNRMTLAPARISDVAGASSTAQERCALLQRQEAGCNTLQTNTSRSASAESSSTAPLCRSTSYKLLPGVPATQHKTSACSLAAALLQGQAGNFLPQLTRLTGKEVTEEAGRWMRENHKGSSSSSVRRLGPGWTDLPGSGERATAGAGAGSSRTAEEVTVPAAASRTQSVTGALGCESEKIICMAPGHATATMLAKTAVSQQMLDTVTLFDEFIRGFEKEFSAEQLQQQRRALLRPALCFAPGICASLSALKPLPLEAGDSGKTCKDYDPACGSATITSLRATKEDTQMLLSQSPPGCCSTMKGMNDSACLLGTGCPPARMILKGQESFLQGNMPLPNPSACSPVPVGGSANSRRRVATGFRLQLRSSDLLVLSRVLVELTSSTYVLVTTLKTILASSTDIVQKHYEKLPATSNEEIQKLSNNLSKVCQRTEEVERRSPKRGLHEGCAELKLKGKGCGPALAVVQNGAKVVVQQHAAKKRQHQQENPEEVKPEDSNVRRCSDVSMEQQEQRLTAESSTKRARTTAGLKEGLDAGVSYTENNADGKIAAPTVQRPTLSTETAFAPKDAAFEARKAPAERGESTGECRTSRQHLISAAQRGEVPSEEGMCSKEQPLLQAAASMEQTQRRLTTSTAPFCPSSADLGGSIGEQEAEGGDSGDFSVEHLVRKGTPEEDKVSCSPFSEARVMSSSNNLQKMMSSDTQQSPRESEESEWQQRQREISEDPGGTTVVGSVAEHRQQPARQNSALGEGTANKSETCITQQGAQDGEQRQQMSSHPRLQQKAEQGLCSEQNWQQRQQWKTQADNVSVSSDGSCTCTNSGAVLHNILTLLQSQQRLVSVIAQLQMSLPQYLRLIIRVAGNCFLPYKLPPVTYSLNNPRTGPEDGAVFGAASAAFAPASGSVTSSSGGGTPVRSSASAGEPRVRVAEQESVKGRRCYLRDQPEALPMRPCGPIAMERSAGESHSVFLESEEKEIQAKEKVAIDLDTQEEEEEMPCPKLPERLQFFSSFSRQSSSVIGFASCGAATSASSTELEYNGNESSALLTGETDRKLSRETVEEETVPSRACEESPHSRTDVGGRKQWEFPEKEFRVASKAETAAYSLVDEEPVKATTIADGEAVTEAAASPSPVTDSCKDAGSGCEARTTTAASASGVASYSGRTRTPFVEVSEGRIIQDEAALEVFLLRPFQAAVCSCQERPCPCDRQHIADLIHMLYTLPRHCDKAEPGVFPTPAGAAPARSEAFLPNAAATNVAGQSVESSVRATAISSMTGGGDYAQRGAAKPDWEECHAGRQKEAAAIAALSWKELSDTVVDLPDCAQKHQEAPLSSTSATCLYGAREAHPATASSSNSKVRFRSHSGIASSRTTSSGSSSSSSEPSTIDAMMLVEESLKQMLFGEKVPENGSDHTSCNPALASAGGSPLCDSQTTGTPHTLLSAAGTPGNALSCASSPFQRGLNAAPVSASCLLGEATRQSTAQTLAEEKMAVNRDGKATGEATLKEEEQTESEGIMSYSVSPALKKAAGCSAPPGGTGVASFSSSVSGFLRKITNLQDPVRGLPAEGGSLAATHSSPSDVGQKFQKLEEKDISSGTFGSILDISELQRKVNEEGTGRNSSTKAVADKAFLQDSHSKRARVAVEQTPASSNQVAKPDTSATVAIEEKMEVRASRVESCFRRRKYLSEEETTSAGEGKTNILQSASEGRAEAASTAGAKPAAGSLEGISGRALLPEWLTYREEQRLQAGQLTVATEGRAHGNVAGATSVETGEMLLHITAADTAGESRKATHTRPLNATCDKTGEQMNFLRMNGGKREELHKHQQETVIGAGATTCSREASRCCVDEDLQKSGETKRESTRILDSLRETKRQAEENQTQSSLFEREGVGSDRAQGLVDFAVGSGGRGLDAGEITEDGKKEGRKIFGEAPAPVTRLEGRQRSCSLLQERQPIVSQEKGAAVLDLSYPTVLASILPLQSLAHTIARLIVHLHRQLICRYVAAHVNVLVDTSTCHSKANLAPAVLQRLVRQLADGDTICFNSRCSSVYGEGNNSSTTTNSSNDSCRNAYSRSSSSEEQRSNRGLQERTSILPDHADAAAETRVCMSDDPRKGRCVEEALAAAELFAMSSAANTSKTTVSGEDQEESLRDRSAAAILGCSGAEVSTKMQQLLAARAAGVNTLFGPAEDVKGANKAGGGAAGEAGRACLDTTAVYCFSPFGTNANEDTPTNLGSSGVAPRFQPSSNATLAAATRISRIDSWNSNKKDREDLAGTGTTHLTVSYADIVRAAAAAVGASSEAVPGAQALLSLSRGSGDINGGSASAVVQKPPFPNASLSCADKSSASFSLCRNVAPNKQGVLPLSSADILERVATLTRSSAGRTSSARDFPPVEKAPERVSDCKATEISQFLSRAQAFYASRDTGEKSPSPVALSSREKESQSERAADSPREDSGSSLLAFLSSAESGSSGSRSCLY